MDAALSRLAKKKIYIGTSSWKYEGWKGMVYHRPYQTQKQFNDTCLEEYAETYPAVGVDHTFYNWPTPTLFQKYFDQTPPGFRFALKVTEKISIWQYPKMKRYGKEAGTKNPHFLDAALFREAFLDPIRPFAEKLGPLMLEFSHFYPGSISSGTEFTARLGRFFKEIEAETAFQFAVEIRNANWLQPPYFDMLVRHNASHVYNSWTKMPQLEEQLALTKDFDFPQYVARLLLRPGTMYEEAVEAFSPYDRVQDEQPELRKAAAALIQRSLKAGKPAFVFVNNRCEGSAPLTIMGVMDLLDRSG